MTKILEVCRKFISYLTILIYNQFERLKFCNMTAFSSGENGYGVAPNKVFTNINYSRILENNRLNETWPKMD